MAVDFKVNMDDERLKAIDNEEATAVKNSNATYDTRIDDTVGAYEDLKNQQTAWEKQQKQLQQEQSDFAIQKIEQQKDQAEKDYIKEQKGAYADWQKESNRYGVNAEQMASQGMGGTGYSETSQVSMWNTYQNRIAVARASYEQIKVDYNNAMNEAILQNNAALAEIAAQAQQKRLELSLNALTAKNELLEQKSARELAIKSHYDSKWQNVLDQINRENQLIYQQQQDEEELKIEKDRLAEEIRQFNIAKGHTVAQYNKNNKAASKGSAASKKVKQIIDAKVEKDAKNANSVKKNTNTNTNSSTKKNKTMLDIIMSDPKYLPAVAKKKFGLSIK